MPTFKHPCPYCGKFIDKISVVCPFCNVREPFAPKRCQKCRKIVEDPAWVSCPSCGESLLPPPPPGQPVPAGASTAGTAPTPPPPPTPGAVPPPPPPASVPMPPAPAPAPAAQAAAATKCSGCGAPIASGQRFCMVCGTLAG